MTSYYHWLGASAEADRVLSPTATEPVVSARSGNARLRCEHQWVRVCDSYNFTNYVVCNKCRARA